MMVIMMTVTCVVFSVNIKLNFIKVLTDKQWVVMEAFPFVIKYNQPLLFSLVVFLKKWA